MASEQPAGWSKRPSRTAAASDLPARSRFGEGWGGEAPVLCLVRRASKRRENKAGGPFDYAQAMLFQHPASLMVGNTGEQRR